MLSWSLRRGQLLVSTPVLMSRGIVICRLRFTGRREVCRFQTRISLVVLSDSWKREVVGLICPLPTVSVMVITGFLVWPIWRPRFGQMPRIERPMKLRSTPWKSWRQLFPEATPVNRWPFILLANGPEHFKRSRDLEFSTNESKKRIDRMGGWEGHQPAQCAAVVEKCLVQDGF